MPTRGARPAVLLAALTVVLLLVVGVLVWQRSGPGPSGAELAREPAVAAPMAAVALGREHLDPRHGLFGARDQHGLARFAYEVDLAPDAAIRAWVDAYGARYGLRTADFDGRPIATGFVDDIAVVVLAGDDVSVPEGGPDARARGFAPPAAGGTVVTVEVVHLGALDDLG
ncbi:hypothetical protein [Cellulomonas sp. IC4_254]|uniref:hypothetical protein n=1 Tax=Cellulomonas sp. IC4_254 TaxID=2714040 RepID=UPI00142047D2|nr:hypothetical protein [Cellulomonas sp. IC4_254]NHT18616.1 hypothetical protein [Cellulomonas sp. IC4_254]